MGVYFIFAGKRGSSIETTLALHEIAKRLKMDSKVVFSKDNEKLEKIRALYPETEAVNFFSMGELSALRARIGGSTAFFTMISPKMVPFFLSIKTKKIFYFHSTYDYSFFNPTLADRAIDFLQDYMIKHSTLTLATQYYLTWQIKNRLNVEAEELPIPSYSIIRPEFFEKPRPISIPFDEYFLKFGDNLFAKGGQVLAKAIDGTNLKAVVAGRGEKLKSLPNLHRIDRWIPDSELHYLIQKSKFVVLPYLVPSVFPSCAALSFRFKKPVLAPFSPAFEKLIEPNKTGLFFSSGDYRDLREKMYAINRGEAAYSPQAIEKKEREMDARTTARMKELFEKLGR